MESDDDLLSRSVWDSAAFETLVRRLSGDVHAYLARRSASDAEDLLAATWLEAFTSRRSFDRSRGPARAWLFGVARHVLLAHQRRSRAALSAAIADRPADPWPAIDARLDAAAVAPRLRTAMAALPEAERELVLLVTWEQLTPSEAAHVVGVPAATARTRLHRARARLRAELSPEPATRPLTTAQAPVEGGA